MCRTIKCTDYIYILSHSFLIDLFTVDLLPSISYHLFADTLQHVNLSYSEQVNDNTMELLATCHCQPISLTIHDCPNVTG